MVWIMHRQSDYVFIYALIDPETDQIRYIGKAKDVIVRFKGHIRDAHRRRSKVYAWINGLLACGSAPIVASLDKVAESEWQDAEKFYIQEYRRCGFNLLNISAGGNEPELKREINAQNGRNTARAIHSDPKRKRIWHLKRQIGQLLRQGAVRESTKQKLRQAAVNAPHLFGEWASL
jgi:hypothetical protein